MPASRGRDGRCEIFARVRSDRALASLSPEIDCGTTRLLPPRRRTIYCCPYEGCQDA